MKFSRFYESVLILTIIFLFIRLVVISGNLIDLSQAGIESDLIQTSNNTLQINHPELLIGPVDGNWTKSYDQLDRLNQSTRVTTTNFCFNKAEPLVPYGVISMNVYTDGFHDINSSYNPTTIIKNKNGLVYIGGEIIN